MKPWDFLINDIFLYSENDVPTIVSRILPERGKFQPLLTPYEAALAIGEAKENFCDKTNGTGYPMDFYAHDSLGK